MVPAIMPANGSEMQWQDCGAHCLTSLYLQAILNQEPRLLRSIPTLASRSKQLFCKELEQRGPGIFTWFFT